eukprot:scaffold278_cov194-Alexandrium_tamarense.AAC.33
MLIHDEFQRIQQTIIQKVRRMLRAQSYTKPTNVDFARRVSGLPSPDLQSFAPMSSHKDSQIVTLSIVNLSSSTPRNLQQSSSRTESAYHVHVGWVLRCLFCVALLCSLS